MAKPMAAPRALVVTAMLLLLAVEASTMAMASKADVNIWNDIGENQILMLQCFSGNNHLGQHTLTYGGQFGWGFTPNLWGTTLFHCDFVWGARSQSFVVWRATFPYACKHCEYRVGPDGFYRNEAGLPPAFYLPWK